MVVRSVWDSDIWKELYPKGWESVRYSVHPELVDKSLKESIFTEEEWGWFNPVPDDSMDYVFGFGAVAVVIGGIAYFGTPALAGVFIAEPGTMTAVFFLGVGLSNWIQTKY